MNIYAALDADNQPYALPAGEPFTTYHQRVADEQEAAWTLTPVGEYAAVEIGHAPFSLNAYGPDDFDRYGIQVVELPDVPGGFQIVSRSLEVHDGVISAVCETAPIPAPPVPQVVSAMQLRRALLSAGLLTPVQTAVDGSGDPDLQLYWQFTAAFHRDHPKVALMIAAVGKTDADADALWTLAGTLS